MFLQRCPPLIVLTKALALRIALSHLDRKGSYVRTLFIHFSSAFNCVIPSILIKKLWDRPISPSLCCWILKVLTNIPQAPPLSPGMRPCPVLTGGPHTQIQCKCQICWWYRPNNHHQQWNGLQRENKRTHIVVQNHTVAVFREFSFYPTHNHPNTHKSLHLFAQVDSLSLLKCVCASFVFFLFNNSNILVYFNIFFLILHLFFFISCILSCTWSFTLLNYILCTSLSFPLSQAASSTRNVMASNNGIINHMTIQRLEFWIYLGRI